MPRVIGDDVGVVTSLVIAKQVEILCTFFKVPSAHVDIRVDLFNLVVCSAKRYFLISIDRLPLSCVGSKGTADYVCAGWSNSCFQSPFLATWGNACPLLGTWIPGLFDFSHLESLEGLNRGADAYAVGKIEGAIEGCINGSGRRWRSRRDEEN